jgi:hypothetical protein
MNSFVKLSAEERYLYCRQAAERMEVPLPAAVIEKDFWVFFFSICSVTIAVMHSIYQYSIHQHAIHQHAIDQYAIKTASSMASILPIA